jgi:UDP-N-acetylglucosamine acyltransferase
MSIHPTAIIESGAELGDNVTVGPFSYIEDHVTIGANTTIGPHVTILKHTTLGTDCKVHAGTILGDLPQDVAFEGGESYAKIGNHCIIREGVTVNRGTKPGTTTVIGNDCFLMAFSHFAHNVKLGDGVTVANGSLLGGYAEVGDQAFISGNCGFHQFVRVGRLAMIGVAFVATKDVPPFCMTRPTSLNKVVGLNVVGMKRAGINGEGRAEVKQAFDTLYRSGFNVSQAVEKLRAMPPEGPAAEFCDFIEKSERGICACTTR